MSSSAQANSDANCINVWGMSKELGCTVVPLSVVADSVNGSADLLSLPVAHDRIAMK
jgi:hypothetical protein